MRTVVVAATLALLPATASAATIVALAEPELSRRSDAIVSGRSSASRTLVNERGQVLTRAELQIYRTVKGPAAGQVITLQVPGGQLASGLIATTRRPRAHARQAGLRLPREGARRVSPARPRVRAAERAPGARRAYRASRDVSGLAMLTPEGQAAAQTSTGSRTCPSTSWSFASRRTSAPSRRTTASCRRGRCGREAAARVAAALALGSATASRAGRQHGARVHQRPHVLPARRPLATVPSTSGCVAGVSLCPTPIWYRQAAAGSDDLTGASPIRTPWCAPS